MGTEALGKSTGPCRFPVRLLMSARASCRSTTGTRVPPGAQTRIAIAERSGGNRWWISLLENGRGDCSIDMCVLLARIYLWCLIIHRLFSGGGGNWSPSFVVSAYAKILPRRKRESMHLVTCTCMICIASELSCNSLQMYFL